MQKRVPVQAMRDEPYKRPRDSDAVMYVAALTQTGYGNDQGLDDNEVLLVHTNIINRTHVQTMGSSLPE